MTSGDDELTSGDDELKADLKELIAKRQVTVVVGTGVSVAATGNAPGASWIGLLKTGIEHCGVVGKSKKWQRREIEKLSDDDGDLDDLLSVAQQITTVLKHKHPAEYANWLEQSIGKDALAVQDDSVIHAIHALRAPILTTNYDDLIERVTELKTANWTEPRKIQKILRGEDSGVIHLHGFWDDPNSVVLGIQDYDQVRASPHTQAVMQSLGLTRSLLFIGCGDGLHDPNFGQFLKWLAQVSRLDPYRNFRLSKSDDVVKHRAEHHPDERIFVLPYGDKYSDLPSYIESLAGPAKATIDRPTAIASEIDQHLDSLCRLHGKLEMIGISAGIPIHLPISQAYVPLRTCHYGSMLEGESGKFDEQSFQRADDLEDVQLHKVFELAGRRQRRGVLLLGEPGAGKTTGARQFAYRLASGEDTAQKLNLPAETLPVFVRLRSLKPDELEAGLEGLIDRQTAVEVDGGASQVVVGPELRGCGRPLLWIFDGLDEVSDESVRKTVCGWISQLLTDRDRDRIVVTSRYQGYEGKVDLGDDFLRFEVQPLDPLSAGQFVHKWFRVVYGCLGLPKDDAETKAEALNGLLNRPTHEIGRLAELRRNPLLLTILCLVYHEDSSLPKNRAKLYERCIKVLLQTWRQQVHVASGGLPYDPDAAKEVLAAIAWQMHQHQDSRSIPIAQMEAYAAEQLPDYANALKGIDAAEFLRLMREESGILAASGAGNIEFLHLTFQEYLAAYFAAQQNEAEQLAKNLPISWWHEAILLALAQGNRVFSRDFFHAVLSGKHLESQLDFIQRCVDEAIPLIDQPFFDFLRSRRKLTAKARVLRLIQGQASERLFEVCREFLEHKNSELRSVAREILQRAGQEQVPTVAEAIQPGVDTSDERGPLVDPKSGITLVQIPAGTFMMGDEGWNDSKPIHEVELTQGFWLGKYPITNEEYARFLQATGHREPSEWTESRFNQPRQPVVGVSWDDAVAFCEWGNFVLPTEAQWEYACRAGSTTAYYFGDDESKLGDYAWYKKNSDSVSHVVGEKLPNDFALHDMSGNVWEWCYDLMNEEYYRESPREDPPGPTTAKWYGIEAARVYRGGSWADDPSYCRSGYRNGIDSAYRHRDLGFRVLRPLSSQAS